jgi:UDP-3-O-[3-hydroxymyristoyl] glucosamine N-acyltransferase
LMLIKHAGGVQIGDGSLILAGAVIAKSLFPAFTTIGKRCQIGIMANVGHGVLVEDDVVISGNSVIAGRTRLGRKVWVGASVSIAQGLKIGSEAQIKMGSVVINDVAAGQVVSGNFAVPHKASMRNFFKIKSL